MDAARRATLIRLGATARGGIANLVGAIVVFVYLTLVINIETNAPDEPINNRAGMMTLLVYGSVAAGVAYVAGLRGFAPVERWIREERVPTESEREATLRQPWLAAKTTLAMWAGGVVVFGVLNAYYENPISLQIRSAVGTMLGGVTTAAIAYLLVERFLRPVFAEALSGSEPAARTRLGVFPRLAVAWALGSGIPFLSIAIAPIARPDATDASRIVGPMTLMAGIGLVAGALLVVFAAKSVQEPLESVRVGLDRVTAGDLRISVPVDDGGAIGRLQAGVNRMAAELREREELRRLFGRHVGEEVAKRALERGVELGGEQRQATALFVDVIGSTGLAQERSPTEVVETLNAFFACVVDAVGREGGWVNKFEGDGALCVFGAPEDQPDHAARALRASRRLRSGIASLGDRFPGLDAGIGVSTGAVVAGNVGAEERYEYTVIGDPVNEAARLTELAKQQPGRVLASECAVTSAGGDEAARWTECGSFELRGRSGRTVVYEPG